MGVDVETLVEAIGLWEQSPPVEFNDFSVLIPVGERLRRTLNLVGEAPAEAARALATYDSFLSRMPAALSRGLGKELDGVLSELVELADRPGADRLPEENRACLQAADEVLSRAAAAGRAGLLSASEVEALGERVRTRVAQLAPRLSAVWQYAEDMELAYGPDPDYPGLFSFWEELACMAQSRLDMETAVATAYMDPARRQALYEKAKDILCPVPAESLAEKLQRWFSEKVEELAEKLRIPEPAPAQASSFATRGLSAVPGLFGFMGSVAGALAAGGPGLPDVNVLVEEKGLISIVQSGKLLTIELPAGNKLTSVKVSADGQAVEIRRTEERNRIEIPIDKIPPTAHIHVRFKLKGKGVELPPIAMPKAKGRAKGGGKRK